MAAVLGRRVPATSPRSRINGCPRETGRHVSIVVVTFNNLVLNRLCLESVLGNTDCSSYEVIVVDNGSTDGTATYLQELVAGSAALRVIFNERNLGFACATNQGLAAATGDVLVLLNNDTIVPPGWLTGLRRHLENPAVGLVGSVTNRAGNEAEIDASYRTYRELVEYAQGYTRAHEGEYFDIRTATMFCVAMRRDVYARVGSLDERFELGMFEDDDYSIRVRQAGLRVVCAEDAFVHHFGGASVGGLAPVGEYGRVFHANRRRFEEKWGVRWEPYGRRPNPEYERLRGRIREVVDATLPAGAIVVIVSRGDDELLKLGGRRGWHFPQGENGQYAGYYPADSAEAIAHLEALRGRGGEFLLFPKTGLWWLDHYHELRGYLHSRYPVVMSSEGTCVIFSLHQRSGD